ncbi:hypothetical protein PS467_04760 [Streptomyces luomodiensis]|uniref:Integral membrane protein n=1 Tax=Streptomyces luomodiensis TaxID=3026192 RepID=A0ABY9UQ66_9ACTN|nr:hypothetical protein [Streptomyces sp. SCA4-21]WNE94697.1 hypothetical protein PS467_04760 [Streptomyces sp. SCA4-21]
MTRDDSTDGEAAADRLLIVEYEQVKEEQRARIGFRDNLLYATLASMAAIITFSLQGHGRPELLLLLPPASTLLGWAYLVNDEKISAIGRYVREDLGPRLGTRAAPGRPPVFGWERAHRDDGRRVSRKRLQLAADLLLFGVAPIAALTVYWTSEPVRAVLLAVSVAEVALVAVLAVQIVLYADLRRP